MSDHHAHGGNKYVSLLQEFSVPLLAGVVAALIVANVNYSLYDQIVHGTWSFVTGDEYHGHGHGGHADGDHGADGHDDHGADAHDDHAEDGHHADHDHGGNEHADDAHSGDDAHGDAAAVKSGHGHDDEPWWHHYATLHFIINDIFMVVFFGIAAKEITEACLPGGALNPVSKAINPLLGTIGGVLGPVGAYFLLNGIMGPRSMAQRLGDSYGDRHCVGVAGRPAGVW